MCVCFSCQAKMSRPKQTRTNCEWQTDTRPGWATENRMVWSTLVTDPQHEEWSALVWKWNRLKHKDIFSLDPFLSKYKLLVWISQQTSSTALPCDQVGVDETKFLKHHFCKDMSHNHEHVQHYHWPNWTIRSDTIWIRDDWLNWNGCIYSVWIQTTKSK